MEHKTQALRAEQTAEPSPLTTGGLYNEESVGQLRTGLYSSKSEAEPSPVKSRILAGIGITVAFLADSMLAGSLPMAAVLAITSLLFSIASLRVDAPSQLGKVGIFFFCFGAGGALIALVLLGVLFAKDYQF